MSHPFVVVPRSGAQRADARSAHRSSAGAGARSGAGAATSTAPPRRALPNHPSIDPLRAHLLDPDATDVFVNGRGGLFVDRGSGAERVDGWHLDDADVRALAVSLISLGGRHLDDATPYADVRWEGGIRVHAVLPPVACEGAVISIRLPANERLGLDDLGRRGMFDAATASRLRRLLAARENLLVTGATGAGKTTLLAALLGLAERSERIVTIEDVAELRLDHPHHVRLEARQPNLEGAGAVSLARLVREALRMRPDRLVVGECRGEEIRELLMALNTGHHGGAGTLHAGGLADVPARLEALGALAGLDAPAVARQVVSAIGVIVHVGHEAGARRITGLARPVLRGGLLDIEELR